MAEDKRRPTGQNQREAVFRDADDRITDDPGAAASVEMVERGPSGIVRSRRKLSLDRSQLPWLPVGETAFLLWVLGALVGVWVAVALVLRLT